jgi:hypothetical protein
MVLESPVVEDTESPAHLQTSYTEVELMCPKCRARWSPPVANLVNVRTHPQGRESMLRRAIHKSRCPACKHPMDVEHIYAVYDPDQKLLVQVRPKWEFKAGGGEEIYWTRLEQLILKHTEDDIRVDVVFGLDELIERFLGGEKAVAAAEARAEQERAEGKPPGTIAMEQARAAAAERGSGSA